MTIRVIPQKLRQETRCWMDRLIIIYRVYHLVSGSLSSVKGVFNAKLWKAMWAVGSGSGGSDGGRWETHPTYVVLQKTPHAVKFYRKKVHVSTPNIFNNPPPPSFLAPPASAALHTTPQAGLVTPNGLILITQTVAAIWPKLLFYPLIPWDQMFFLASSLVSFSFVSWLVC